MEAARGLRPCHGGQPGAAGRVPVTGNLKPEAGCSRRRQGPPRQPPAGPAAPKPPVTATASFLTRRPVAR